MSNENDLSESSEQFEIQDQSCPHHYRTEIPNIIFRISLSPDELSVYIHLKHTAGDRGKCFKSNATLSKQIGISVPTLIKAKKSLCSRNLIKIAKRTHENGNLLPDLITIVNIWPENYEYFLQLYPKRSEDKLEGVPPPTKADLLPLVNGVYQGSKRRLEEQEPKVNNKQTNKRAVPAAAVVLAPTANAAQAMFAPTAFACLEAERCSDLTPENIEAIHACCLKLDKSEAELINALDLAYDPKKQIASRVAYIINALKKGYKPYKKRFSKTQVDDSEPVKSKVVQMEENRQYAAKFHGCVNQKGAFIRAEEEGMVFSASDEFVLATVEYEEKDFEECVRTTLIKYGFPIQ